jgi:TolA-binding protein
MRSKRFLLTLVLLSCASIARADTVWVSSGSAGNALELSNVKVADIREGKLIFLGVGGRETTRELSQIARLRVDDDAGLTAGEDALANSQWDAATDAFLKVMATSKPWAKQWAAGRLAAAAPKANRFDAAVKGYIALVKTDPARASALKPAPPDARSTYLTTALSDVTTSLADPQLPAAQRQALLSFQLELERAKKDDQAIADTMEKLLKTGATTANDPNAAAALARLKLDQAGVTLGAKDYDKVITDLNANAGVFIDPRDQVQAMFLIAEARLGQAIKSNQPAAWQDAALAYMRVVAHFKDGPPSPLVARSLLKAAQIEEKLQDRDGAIAIYDQLAAQFPAEPPAADAKAALQRLKAKP